MDARRGGDIKKNLELLSSMEGDDPWSDEAVESYHRKRLYQLLRHCVETVSAYSGLGYLLSRENPIEDWPVVNKLSFNESRDTQGGVFVFQI